MTRSSSKDYKVNGINIHCPIDIKTTDENGYKKYLTDDEKLCDLLSGLRSLAGYNLSRMQKLNVEYKCSPWYKKSDEDERDNPNCSDNIYKQFSDKFQDAALAVKSIQNQIASNNIHISSAKVLAQVAINEISHLKSYTQQNLDKVNAAFEKAFYDTNVAGVGTAVATLFGGLGFFSAFANIAFYNNEFDGKIDRAYNDAIEVSDKLTVIAEIISHSNSDMDVY